MRLSPAPVLALLLLAGCASSPPAAPAPSTAAPDPPAAVRELEPAEAVGAADLDGDGSDELVLVRGGIARWSGRETLLGGRVQVVARCDLDGDGREALLLGTGYGRGQSQAPARVWALEQGDARIAWERQGVRDQIAELRCGPGGLWMAVFADERQVEGGWLRPGEGGKTTFEPQLTVALGLRQAPVGGGGVVVGRLYGDEPRSDGDLALHVGAVRTVLPSLRGVRSLAVADLDGDGGDELIVGDGWHFRYGSDARARLRLLEGPGWRRARAVAELDGEYSVREVEVVGQGGQAWLLATGSSQVHRLVRDALGWRDEPLGAVAETGNAVFARQEGRDGVLISGDPARWVPVGGGS
ncbi:MAG: hypothetical protein ABIO70_32610 [Pseudomonadota bacterium]